MNIFVAKLNFRTTSEELHGLFEQFGPVTSAKVIIDQETGKSKGFGFVEMVNDEDANHALQELNEAEFHERTIVVKEARPREARRPYNNNGGGGNNYDNYNNRY